MSGEDDLLERATRALRAAPPPTRQELAAGRARLLAAQRALQQKSRARSLRWVLPLAAVLTAGSALAATTGQLERVVRAVSELFSPEAAEAPKKRAKRPRPAAPERPEPAESFAPVPPLPVPEPARAASPEPQPGPPEQPAPASPALAEPGQSSRTRSHGARGARAPAPERVEQTAAEPDASAPEPEQSAPEPLPSPDLARYREAHRLHFQARNFGAALAAWDAYLAEFSGGTFVIEARYNRAICLVRLGRKREAKQALSPFARGEVGRGYRKAEASELLEALE